MHRDPAFFWRPNNIASRGRGGGKNRSATKFRKNDPQEGNFLNSFVQDCRWDNPLRWEKNNPRLHAILQPRYPMVHFPKIIELSLST